jgi:hypothetical protein
MKRPLDVLLIESRSGVAADESEALRAAGHRVHRCHDSGDDSFACAGMKEGQTCPLDGPIDVVLLVHRGVWTEQTHVEDGVRCAVRAGVPIVEFGSDAPRPFDPWVSRRVEPGGSAVSECVVAADRSLDPLRDAVADKIRPLLLAAGIDPELVTCDVEPVPPALAVHIDIPVPIDRQLEQVLGVRVLDAVRAASRTYGQVRVLVHHPEATPAASA